MSIENKTINEVNTGPITNFPLHVWWSAPQVETAAHRHSFTELVIILKGKAEHEQKENIRTLVSGDVLVIPPGISHRYTKCTHDFSLVNIIFIPEQLPIPLIDISLLPGFNTVFHGIRDEQKNFSFLHLPKNEFIFLRKLAKRLWDEDRERTPGYRFAMLGTFMLMLSALSRYFSHGQGKNPQIFLHINGVISYLNRHFKSDCPISTLCRVAGMSRATLQRHFLNATGTSPRQYQIQLRIAESTTLLRSSDKTVDEIAAELGFGNRNYFSRQFHNIIGCSPIKFRKQEESFHEQ